ncbi:MAG TPA: BadF/BadG/BcrA/BcrD ATPase family protein [Bryobacteraceae bacterium]|jgi:N-acetylglucosamine kinase-like BadF-type ATPase
MRRFLGVDGGQSSTVALIGDETGRVVGIGRGPGCRNAGAIEAALGEAGGGSFEAACFGLSGGTAGRETALRELVHAEHYVFTHDADIALTGALAGEPGIIVIAGTGSMAFGRNASGQMARAGGWGYAFGDEGGAFDLVRQALRAALRQEEGWGPATILRAALLDASGAANANHLMHRFYTDEWPRERIAALAPVVDQAAAAGDSIAQEILKGAAQSLAALAGIVRGQLFAQNESVGVSYTGGVFRSPVALVRFRMLMELDESNRLEAPRFGPAAGALIEAYRAGGLRCLPTELPLEK